MNRTITTHEFLAALFGEQADGYVELRHCTPGESSVWAPFPLKASFINGYVMRLMKSQDAKPYFGCAVRRVRGGKNEDCARLTAIYIDADFKHASSEAWLSAFDAHPYKPSMVVLTGGGFQAYWLLDVPYEFANQEARDAMRRLLERWRLTFPHSSDELTDTARVFRLPGTLNRKYDPPRMSEVVLFEPSRRYAVEDLRAHADQMALASGESVPERGAAGIAPPYVLPPTLDEGGLSKGRHYTLGQFLRSIKSRYDLTWPEALALLRAVNRQRVRPPIPERELEGYLRRWWNRADNPDVVRPAPTIDDEDEGTLYDADDLDGVL